MTEADKKLLTELKEIVLRNTPGATLLLYGSTARSERRPDSDYDVLILTDEMLSDTQKDLISTDVFKLELAHDVLISTIFRTKSEWNSPLYAVMPFHQNVEREAIPL
jgi:predicted nucleotidyltransferase